MMRRNHLKPGQPLFRRSMPLLIILILLSTWGCPPAETPEQTDSTPTSVPVSKDAMDTGEPAKSPAPTSTVSVTAIIPSEAQSFYDMGLAYYAAGAFEEAIAPLGQAIALAPDYAQAYLYRGLAYQEEGQLEQAQTDFQQVLALSTNPDELAQANAGLKKLETMVQITPTPQPGPTNTPQPTVLIPAQPPVEAQLNQPFTLYLGQEAHFPGEDLSVIFLDVPEDSRCPSQVECAWSGQAIILIQAQLNGLTPAKYELNNNPILKEDAAGYMKYNIKFVKLEPYPEHPEKPIPPAMYAATLVGVPIIALPDEPISLTPLPTTALPPTPTPPTLLPTPTSPLAPAPSSAFSGVYQQALKAASANTEVVRALGTPIEGARVRGMVETTGALGEADIGISISGSQNSGTLYAVASKRRGRAKWTFTLLELLVDGQGEPIDLLAEGPIPNESQQAADSHYERGYNYVNSGRYEQALVEYTQATELDPEFAAAYNSLCWTGSLSGHAAEVLEACERGVELEPDNGAYRDSRGLGRALTGDYAGTIE